MDKIKNLFLHAEKMNNLFVSSNGFYSMQAPQGALLFSPDDKLLAKKADFVSTWAPHFYGISKNNLFSLYKTNGKCILKDVLKIAVTRGCATHHINTHSDTAADYHVIIWKNGWYSIKYNGNLTLYNEKDEALFDYLINAKEFSNGYYAIQNFEGWKLYTEKHEVLADKAQEVRVLPHGYYADKGEKYWTLYNAKRECLTSIADDFKVSKTLYAIKQDRHWRIYRSTGELFEEHLKNVRLWDNGYYAFPDGNGWKLYNQNDQLLASQASEFVVFQNGFFGARDTTGNLIFCSPDCTIMTTKAKNVFSYCENTFFIERRNGYELRNLKGKILTQSPLYIRVSKNGLYAVEKNEIWNVYDLQGKLLGSSISEVEFDDNGCYSLQIFNNKAEAMTPRGKITTFTQMRMEICEDGYYIGYYGFLRALYSPKGELLYKNLRSAHSLGNQQFLLQDDWDDFVYFVDLSKDCLGYFQNLLKEMEQKKIPLTEMQKEYAKNYIAFLKQL